MFLKLLQVIIIFFATVVCQANDSTKVILNNFTVLNYNAKVDTSNCYDVETREILIQAQDDVGSSDSADSQYCSLGYSAMRTGGLLKVREIHDASFRYVLRAISSIHRIACCKIIYKWE